MRGTVDFGGVFAFLGLLGKRSDLAFHIFGVDRISVGMLKFALPSFAKTASYAAAPRSLLLR
jgi:hypothetical protein